MDPFLELIRLLRPRAMLTAGIYVSGQWAVSFPMWNDVLFCWLELVERQLFRERADPVPLRPGDFLLIRTSASFVLGTDPALQPEDSESLVATLNDLVSDLATGLEFPRYLKAAGLY